MALALGTAQGVAGADSGAAAHAGRYVRRGHCAGGELGRHGAGCLDRLGLELRLLARSVGTHILAATDRNQYAIELARLGHGVFTYALLEGLKGKADTGPADGIVTASEVIRFVEKTVPLLAEQYTSLTATNCSAASVWTLPAR